MGVEPHLTSAVPYRPYKRIVHARVLLFVRRKGALAQGKYI